jgi:hypothetical protein
MAKTKLTIEEAASIIEGEGLEYAPQHHTSGDKFADPKLRKLWNAAGKGLDSIDEYIKKNKPNKLGKPKMEKPYTIEDAIYILDMENVQDYTSGDSFRDKKFGKLWDSAQKALNNLEQYVNDYMESKEENEESEE